MKRHTLTAAIAAALLAFVNPAWAECRYKGSDIMGASSCFSPEVREKLRNVPFNIVDLPKAEITGVKKSLRNNAVEHWTISLSGKGGWVRVQVAHMAFSIRTTSLFSNIETLRAAIRRSKGTTGNMRNERMMKTYDHRAGMVEYELNDGRWCIAGGALFDPYETSQDHFKQLLRFKDCTGKRSTGEVFGWLKSLKAVSAGYNR